MLTRQVCYKFTLCRIVVPHYHRTGRVAQNYRRRHELAVFHSDHAGCNGDATDHRQHGARPAEAHAEIEANKHHGWPGKWRHEILSARESPHAFPWPQVRAPGPRPWSDALDRGRRSCHQRLEIRPHHVLHPANADVVIQLRHFETARAPCLVQHFQHHIQADLVPIVDMHPELTRYLHFSLPRQIERNILSEIDCVQE